MILITRPQVEAIKLINEFKKRDLHFHSEPLTSFRYSSRQIKLNLEGVYLVSSLQSVHFFKKNKNNHNDLKKYGNFIVIGKAVSDELMKLGFQNILKVVNDSNHCIAYISTNKKIVSINHLCGSITNDILQNYFTNKKSINYKKIIIYKTKLKKHFSIRCRTILKNRQIGKVVFYSLTAVIVFCKLTHIKRNLSHFKNIQFYCISKRVADGLIIRGIKNKNIHVAQKPDQKSVLKMLV